MSESAQLGALVATARASEIGTFHALLDSVDPQQAQVWAVLQGVTESDRDAIAARPEVRHVIASDLLPLSHARNLALHEIYSAAAASGVTPAYVGFPDADGRYAPGALAAVTSAFAAGADFVVGRYGPQGQPFDDARFPTEPGPMDWALARQRATSVTLFLSGRTAYDLGYVVPYLGLGTPWPAGEDVELALRALRRGYSGVYEPSAVTWHPYGTELNPARRPVRYLLVAAYPPPLGSVSTAAARLRGGPSVPASQAGPTQAQSTTSVGLSAELRALAKGLAPTAVRRLTSFARATPDEQWVLVQRDGPTGSARP